MNIHPLIHFAETMALDGYTTGTAHDALVREAQRHMDALPDARITGDLFPMVRVVSAMTLAESILHKREAALPNYREWTARDELRALAAEMSIFPIPPATKEYRVRTKGGTPK